MADWQFWFLMFGLWFANYIQTQDYSRAEIFSFCMTLGSLGATIICLLF